MSYEIVRSIKLIQDENQGWYAILTSACNNLRPLYFSKANYAKGKGFTKEQLQAEILFDFFSGNLQGGKSTKYGKFISSLDNTEFNKITSKYNTLLTKLRHKYLEKNPQKYTKIRAKLTDRRIKVLKKVLFKLFNDFSIKHKPCVVRIWNNSEPIGYYYRVKNQRNTCWFTYSYEEALNNKFTDSVHIAKAKKVAKSYGFKAEIIEV